MARVLVIEDDELTASGIAENLGEHGFEVTVAGTGTDGLAQARDGKFDVITVDRMLPGLSGLDVIERLRSDGIGTPVLVLSALGELDDRVGGLRAGGDDYMVKPFAFVELRARLEALLRRAPEPRGTLLRVGDLELDLLGRTAHRGPRSLRLTPREMQLLEYLMRHAGQVVTRAMLFEQVWKYRFDPRTNLVDVHVGRLRRELEQPGEKTMLESVRGAGFRLAATPE
jgi:two-component system OmpR family response regulator